MHPNLFLALLTGKIIQLSAYSFIVNNGWANADFVQYFPTPTGVYRVTMGMN